MPVPIIDDGAWELKELLVSVRKGKQGHLHLLRSLYFAGTEA
jgi:hypothetical protein